MEKYPDQTRNLNPTPEAKVAQIMFGERYAQFRGGVMDFWDVLPVGEKRRCSMVVKALSHSGGKQGEN